MRSEIDTVGKVIEVEKTSKKSRKKKKVVKVELESKMEGATKEYAGKENTVENVKEESTPNTLLTKKILLIPIPHNFFHGVHGRDVCQAQ